MFRDQDSFATFNVPTETLNSLEEIAKSIVPIGDQSLPEIYNCQMGCSGSCAGTCSGNCAAACANCG